MLRFDRKQQNSVKQLSFNEKNTLKKKKIGELSGKRKVSVETWVRRETGARERDWVITVSLQGK